MPERCDCEICSAARQDEAERRDEPTPVCYSCGAESTHTLDGESYCEECHDDLVVFCAQCNEALHREGDYTYYVDSTNEYACETCYMDYYFTCYSCEDRFPDNDGLSTVDGTYCMGCAEEYLVQCESCSDSRHTNDMYWLDTEHERRSETGEWLEDEIEDWRDDQYDCLCYNCAREAGWMTAGGRAEQDYIRDYYYKPSIQVRVDEKGRLLDSSTKLARMMVYGLELEVENFKDEVTNRAAAKHIIDVGGGLLYCKNDSSIQRGFEIVSHPGVEEFWSKGTGREVFDTVLAYLRESGFQSDKGGRCGLHIHANKTPLSRLHRFNLARFFHEPRMRMFLFGLSRRSEGQLSSYSMLTLPENPRGMEDTVKSYASMIARGGSNSGRGTVLNLQGPTAELRLFRGSLDPVKFWGAYQFYNLVMEYTDPKRGNLRLDETPTWASYRQFVESYPQGHRVAELRTHLKELGI